ncbi:hypothetical protein [Sulfitobacter pontiacus]|uniref:hypothetical protein n=1 Tax=Sulfitobacter pontiacus TaxID=60137 RepID=UPI0030EB4544
MIAILCETVPIYWGCPNIGDFLDVSGMIVCETQEQAQKAILAMSESRYNALLPGLHAAKPQATSFMDIEKRAAEMIKASL